MTKQELISHIVIYSRASLEELAERSRATLDSAGCPIRCKVVPGLSVAWVSNPNYCGGKRNGYGPGLYAFAQQSGVSVDSTLILPA